MSLGELGDYFVSTIVEGRMEISGRHVLGRISRQLPAVDVSLHSDCIHLLFFLARKESMEENS